jgi:hypothetical protein
MFKLKRKTKKKLLTIRKIVCKSVRKGFENMGEHIVKTRGLT